MELTNFEIKTIKAILDSTALSGSTIKDIRILNSTLKTLSEKELPDLPRPVFQDTDTEEQKQAVNETWITAVRAQADIPITIQFSDFQYGLIKQKIASFKGFRADEFARERTIQLADKFDVR